MGTVIGVETDDIHIGMHVKLQLENKDGLTRVTFKPRLSNE